MEWSLLLGVFEECPHLLPDKAIRDLVPLQTRLQQTLRKHRKVVESDAPFYFKLPLLNQDPAENIKFIINELESLTPQIDPKLKVYNYPVIERRLKFFERKKSFVLAIDYFFDSFLKCDHLHLVLEDESLLPNLISPIKSQFYEAFGFFLGSALILQHPLRFRLNTEYFNLIRSVFKPEFIRLLFEIYPKTSLPDSTISDLSDQLEGSTSMINPGLLKAFDADYFTSDEIYKLLFPTIFHK